MSNLMEEKLKIHTVSEITHRIKVLLERSVGFIWIEGEVSNLSYHQSGHVYLTLKDADAQISGVMFRMDASRLGFRIKDGMQIQGYGQISVYGKRGNYQIILKSLQPSGVGNLQAAFEALKRKLEAEGLFAQERKRPLPDFPETVGVVTSPTGAAVRDFCKVLHRRFPGVRIIIAPTAVQGAGAAQEIAAAIDLLNVAEASGLHASIDVIAIIRGGGSLEDLWAFNEEVVARAVARSKIPTISGIGHEIDFTICDFVADLRAPTPSAAAELLIRSRAEFLSEVIDHGNALQKNCRIALHELNQRLLELRESLRRNEPRSFIRERRQRLDDATSALARELGRSLQNFRDRWHDAVQGFSKISPLWVVERKKSALLTLENRFQQTQKQTFTRIQTHLSSLQQRLELLSPKGTLKRGYSITLDAASRKVIHSCQQLKKNQVLLTHLSNGEVHSRVTTQPENEPPAEI